jgi:hypothetical protein
MRILYMFLLMRVEREQDDVRISKPIADLSSKLLVTQKAKVVFF